MIMSRLTLLMIVLYMSFNSCTTKKSVSQAELLEGTWQLTYITGPRIAFDGLYPNKKPTIVFDVKNNKIAGNNSCNQYFGTLIIDDNTINFKDAKMGMTMMACEGNGDDLYMETIQKIETYTISEDGKTLNLLIGNIEMLRFVHQ